MMLLKGLVYHVDGNVSAFNICHTHGRVLMQDACTDEYVSN